MMRKGMMLLVLLSWNQGHRKLLLALVLLPELLLVPLLDLSLLEVKGARRMDLLKFSFFHLPVE